MKFLSYVFVSLLTLLPIQARSSDVGRGIVSMTSASLKLFIISGELCSKEDGYWIGYNSTIATFNPSDLTINYDNALIVDYNSIDCSIQIDTPATYAKVGSRIRVY